MQRPCGREDRLCGEREGLKEGLCGTVLPCFFTSEAPEAFLCLLRAHWLWL